MLQNKLHSNKVTENEKQILEMTMFKVECMLIDLPQYASLYARIPPIYVVWRTEKLRAE